MAVKAMQAAQRQIREGRADKADLDIHDAFASLREAMQQN